MAYKLTDRLKEWTTYAGVVLAGVGAVIPDLIPPDAWSHYLGDAQIILGAAMAFMPQSAGSTTAIEQDAVSLLQAFTSKMPADYAESVRPVLNSLARAAIAHQIVPPTSVATLHPQLIGGAAPIVVAAQPGADQAAQAPADASVKAVPVPAETAAQAPSRVSPNLGAK
jgi:hypothetical protein